MTVPDDSAWLSPDFRKPGADGGLPDGFEEFQRGLIYTVHPRILSRLIPGEEYRILASTRHKFQATEQPASYEPFYRRVKTRLDARIAELQCEHDVPLHTWTASHGWFRMPVPGGALAGAAIALGVMCATDGASLPAGESEPAADDLRIPFVDQLAAVDQRDAWRWDEFYNEFDFGPANGSIVTLSYGEYVSTADGLDFEPLIRRAEHRARVQHALSGEAADTFRIVRREWSCIETGKTSLPLLAHVDVYFEAAALTACVHSTARS